MRAADIDEGGRGDTPVAKENCWMNIRSSDAQRGRERRGGRLTPQINGGGEEKIFQNRIRK